MLQNDCIRRRRFELFVERHEAQIRCFGEGGNVGVRPSRMAAAFVMGMRAPCPFQTVGFGQEIKARIAHHLVVKLPCPGGRYNIRPHRTLIR